MLSSAHPSTCAWPIPAAPALLCMQTKTLIVVLCLSSLWSHQSHSLCYPKELHPSLSCLLQDACVPWEDMLTNSLSSHPCSQHGPQHPQLQQGDNPNLVYSWPIIPLLIIKVTGEIQCLFFFFTLVCECPNFCFP